MVCNTGAEEWVQALRPTANGKVKCHYHGTLINGQVFDSSRTEGRARRIRCFSGNPGMGRGFAVDASRFLNGDCLSRLTLRMASVGGEAIGRIVR